MTGPSSSAISTSQQAFGFSSAGAKDSIKIQFCVSLQHLATQVSPCRGAPQLSLSCQSPLMRPLLRLLAWVLHSEVPRYTPAARLGARCRSTSTVCSCSSCMMYLLRHWHVAQTVTALLATPCLFMSRNQQNNILWMDIESEVSDYPRFELRVPLLDIPRSLGLAQ